MRGELVTVTSRDFVRLHGFFAPPVESSTYRQVGVVLLHGLGGNFYGSPLLTAIAQHLRDMGFAVVLANTRGHDLLNWTACAGRSRLLGGATEDVADSVADVAAWVSFLRRQGFGRVALIGHSLGAIKALFAQCHGGEPDVFTIIALSPTRLNHQLFLAGPKGNEFKRTFLQAEQWVAAGQGDQLMRIEFPFTTWMSAEGYVHKYGRDDRFDWFRFIDRLTIPALLIFGERELDDHPAFFGLKGELAEAQRSARWPHLTIETISNADHFYVACYRQVTLRCAAWLNQ